MKRHHTRLFCLLTAVLLLGCGGDKEKQGWSRALAQLTAEQGEWNGWQALTMKNGLITVVTVPAMGGRTMAYNLGQRALLWVNPDELDKTSSPPAPPPDSPPAPEAERTWRNFGGYKTWPAPQEKWGGPGDPAGSFLDGGPYRGEILEKEGKQVRVRVAGEAERDATGIRFQRTLTLFHGTTRLRVEQAMTNISDTPQEWSIWDVTQVPGLLEEGADFSPQARVYFPLPPKSRFQKGFFAFREEWEESAQWQPLAGEGLMRVEYQHQTGKIGSDSEGGWIAFADELHETIYVKRFPVFPEENYPDQGARVEVYTSGAEPYMEVEVLSPLKTLQPGETYTFTQDWYAARCPGPVRAVTEWGATHQPLRAEARDSALQVTGVFGVFTEGWARLIVRDAQGRELRRGGRLLVTPSAVFRLEEGLERPEGAARVEVLLLDGDDRELGVLASAEVVATPIPSVQIEEEAPVAPVPETPGGQETVPPTEPTEGPDATPADAAAPLLDARRPGAAVRAIPRRRRG